MAWHDSGWNGEVCNDPQKNDYCKIFAHIRYHRFDKKTKKDNCLENDGTYFRPRRNDWMPLCNFERWAFTDPSKDYDNIGTVLYDHIDTSEFKNELENERSLIIPYVNYNNPINSLSIQENDFLIVGALRIVEHKLIKGTKPHYQTKKEWREGHFLAPYNEDAGFRIPYQEYLESDLDIDRILFKVPQTLKKKFRSMSNFLENDDLISILEELIRIANNIKEDGFVFQREIDSKILWLNKQLETVWADRGVYPGLPAVLLHLGIKNGVSLYKEYKDKNQEDKFYKRIFEFIESYNPKADKLFGGDLKSASRSWIVLTDATKDLLKNHLPYYSLNSETLEEILYQIDSGKLEADRIFQNPYSLFEEFTPIEDAHVSFQNIDIGEYYRLSGGFDPLNPCRIRALIIEKLKEEESLSGSCFLTSESLEQYLADKNKSFSKTLRFPSLPDLESFYRSNKNVFEKKLTFKSNNDVKIYYLKEVYEDERLIEEKVSQLLKEKYPVFDASKYLPGNKPEGIRQKDYDEAVKKQAEALKKLISNGFTILSGKAGTGKTSTIKALIDSIKDDEDFLLLAPTGKASDVLGNATKQKAQTIHRFLKNKGWLNEGYWTFKKTGGQIVKVRNLVIDEASMVNLNLMATLFRAIDSEYLKRIILIGDSKQLPPIGYGKPFFDIYAHLKNKHPENLVELEVILRTEGRNILELAEFFATDDKLRKEEILESLVKDKNLKDREIGFWSNKDELYNKIEEILSKESDKFPGAKNYEKFNNMIKKSDYIEILSPLKKDIGGTLLTNQFIQNESEFKKRLKAYKNDFKWLDKVIQVKNDYTKEIFNGMLGILSNQNEVTFSAKKVHFNYDELKENIVLGYAITVHKSQGSEFDVVIFILPSGYDRFITTELLYTGLTRPKTRLYLLIQDGINTLINYNLSEIARRNSSIFGIFLPLKQPYPEFLIYLLSNHVRVRSKSEVIIGNLLEKYREKGGLDFAYETPIYWSNGDFCGLTDFEIKRKDGVVFYWEHLGRMDELKYKKRWKEKGQCYKDNGYNLITTTEKDVKDSTEIENIIKQKLIVGSSN